MSYKMCPISRAHPIALCLTATPTSLFQDYRIEAFRAISLQSRLLTVGSGILDY